MTPRSRAAGLSSVLAHAQLSIAASAAAHATLVTMLTGPHPSAAPADLRDAVLLPTLVIGFIYGMDRVIKGDDESDAVNHPERAAFAARWGRVLGAVYVAGLLVALALAILQGPWTLALAIAPLGVGVAYAVPLPGTSMRIKDLPG
ncbi:MAG: hypothetical protein AAF602_23080, partial [Myxococcota bacterium]